tara:strand:- start:3 stop:1043 length:1041 start_codon:yes stop_codon:yes gene_type:complete
MKKKKIFLGAYVNINNAQNINCKALATYLDKEKYLIKTLKVAVKEPQQLNSEITYITVFKHLYILSNFFAFLYGIMWSDLSYLPKHHSTPILVLKIAKIFNKKIFTTIEGNICDSNYKSMIDSFGSKQKMLKYFSLIPNIYGITNHISSNTNCGIHLHKKPLFLGVDRKIFDSDRKVKKLRNIIFIGSLIKRKRIFELLEIAKEFKNLNFHIVGSGPLKSDILKFSSKNVILYDHINNNEIPNILLNMDLNILLSRSEGFPKVILEAASASIPSIVYNNYGMQEIIKTNRNGFVLKNKKEVIEKIHELIRFPKLLYDNSMGAYELSKDFDWNSQIKEWELEIDLLI